MDVRALWNSAVVSASAAEVTMLRMVLHSIANGPLRRGFGSMFGGCAFDR